MNEEYHVIYTVDGKTKAVYKEKPDDDFIKQLKRAYYKVVKRKSK